MLISHQLKFIYTKTGKTAGTSVEAYFERFILPEGSGMPQELREMYESELGVIGYRGYEPHAKKWYNHMPAYKIRQLVGKRIWKQYFKFCVIRNPYEKIISYFEFNGGEHRLPGGDEGDAYHSKYPSHNSEQLRFLHWLETKGVPIDRLAYTIDGSICVDDFIRFELLHQDMERICKKLMVDWQPSLLPKFKSGIRRKSSTVLEMYKEPARRLVEESYSFEIKYFGYKFPSLVSGENKLVKTESP